MLDVLREKGNPSRASIARDALVDIGSRSAQRTWNVVTTDRWSDARAVPASRLLMAPHTRLRQTQPFLGSTAADCGDGGDRVISRRSREGKMGASYRKA